MAIPDAPSGGEDKSLSDIYENARPDLHLPELLHAEAHTDSLPLTAPDSNVLPKVTLAKSVEGKSLPTSSTPATFNLDSNSPQAANESTEVVATSPPAAPQVDVTQQPIRVADSTVTPPANYSPAPNTLVLDNPSSQTINAKPPEMVTASSAATPLIDVTQQPIRVADSTGQSPANYSPAPNTLVLDNPSSQTINAKPPEMVTASSAATPLIDVTQQPIRVADSTGQSPANYSPAPNTLVLDNPSSQTINAKPPEMVTASSAATPLIDVTQQPIRVADSTGQSPANYSPAPNTLVLDNPSSQTINAKPPEMVTASSAATPLIDVTQQPIRVADSTGQSPANYSPAPNTLVLDNPSSQTINAKPPEMVTASSAATPLIDVTQQPIRVADSTGQSPANYSPAPNTLVLDNPSSQTINAKPPEIVTASSAAAPQLENLQQAARTAEASTTPHQTLVASGSVDTGRTVAELVTNKKVKSGLSPDLANFQYVAQNYVSTAPNRVETTTETPTPIPPAQRIHSQLAMAKEATPDPASPIQSYPHSKNTKTAAESSPSTSATPDTLSTKRAVLNPTHSTDPQSLLVALETPIRGLKSIQPTSSFTDGIVPVNKLGLPTLQTTAASVGLSTPTPSEGRIVQNIGQPATTDTPQTTLDPHKISSSLIPGAVGPGIFTGQQGERDTSRTLHVPDLNLDEATHKPTSGKGKPHSTTNQPIITETNIVSQNTVAEAELADLLGRTKKGKKEKTEPGKIDTSTTPASTTTKQPQTRPSNERLKHKVKASETLDDIAHRYFGDSRVATLIMEINSSILNPHVEKDAVIISLLVDTIIDIPSEAEVLKFRRQLASGKKTRANIICV